ncbi:MAG: TonB-dependent receptor [Pseudomonadota bacterium]
MIKQAWTTVIAVALGMAVPGLTKAQQPARDEAAERALSADEIVVLGEIPFRNRTETAEPILAYDAEFFQRFEPLTAGDALRRVPSVTFLSDVIESDGPRLRGLAPSYAQLLINGERVPGGENDRSFFLDRIPAELIERVEIIRSSSARRTGDSVAGALNIILRDGYDLDGGYIRAGGLYFDDGELKPSLGAVYGGEVGPGRLLLGANLQGRYNPKEKKSIRFGDGPENNPNFVTEDFDNREDQTDIRDGTDYSFNGRYTISLDGGGEFELGGFVTYTDREESERSFEYDDPSAITGPVSDGGNLLTDNQQLQDIEQTSYVLDGGWKTPAFGGEFAARAGFATYTEERDDNEDEIDFEDGEIGQEREVTDIDDDELTLEASQLWDVNDTVTFEVGLYWQDKARDIEILAGDQDIAFSGSWDPFSQQPFSLRTSVPDVSAIDAGVVKIEETRLDVYGVFNGVTGNVQWEAGIRFETTDADIEDLTVPATADNDYDFILPSVSVKYDITDRDRITASAARTVRRPGFDQLSPALLEGEIEDDDFLGNPALEPEDAFGFDLGYERRIGDRGIVGINVFWRNVDNLIELVNLNIEGSDGPGSTVFQPQNVGDGDVYGVELDVSMPLSFIGLDNTGFFSNYSYLDSEVTDFLGDRRFNDQSDFVFSVGFIHSIPSADAAFGVTYREQGDAFGRVVAEEVTTRYGADLEAFIEKSFGEKLTVRLVGQNLLNASKDEDFNKFSNLDDQIARNFDEFELESEEAGPVIQLIARYAF